MRIDFKKRVTISIKSIKQIESYSLITWTYWIIKTEKNMPNNWKFKIIFSKSTEL